MAKLPSDEIVKYIDSHINELPDGSTEEKWLSLLQLLDYMRMQGLIVNYRASDPENHTVEIQPTFSVRPILEVRLK